MLDGVGERLTLLVQPPLEHVVLYKSNFLNKDPANSRIKNFYHCQVSVTVCNILLGTGMHRTLRRIPDMAVEYPAEYRYPVIEKAV